jgi:hypothetical protein
MRENKKVEDDSLKQDINTSAAESAKRGGVP